MKEFDEEIFANILTSKRVMITDYVKNSLNEDEELLLRPLEVHDHTKGYLQLIFDDVENADHAEQERVFEEYLSLQESCPDTYYTVVVENVKQNKIIASGTLIVEQKFIHEIARRGRIENMIVSQQYRRMKIGSVVLGLLTYLAEQLGCYKTTLNCHNDVVPFCEKMKYLHEPGQNFMMIHIPKITNGQHS